MHFERILKFLKDLTKNNDRTWFEKNKPRYLDAKKDFEDFVAALQDEIIKFDPKVAGVDPKKLPFRIYRDVRFSKDKRPYKTNMGAGISPNGKLVQEPGYYIHIEPGQSFVAGGIYMPDAENLAKIRQEIDYNGEQLTNILKDKTFRKLYPSIDDFDKMKTSPKGYSKEHPHLELLKYRSLTVTHVYTDKEVMDKKFVKTVASHAKVIKPLVDFIREAQS